jgi:histidine triad (HIT) family protein
VEVTQRSIQSVSSIPRYTSAVASVFTQILMCELPGFIVWEDDDFAAILDIHSINPGHILLIPKLEEGSVYDLSATLYGGLWERVKTLDQP